LMVIGAVFCVNMVSAQTDPDLAAFLQFIKQYNKTYSNDGEWDMRYHIFKENLVRAADLNANDSFASYGVTKFADMTPEEFRDTYLIKNFTSPKMRGEKYPVLPKLKKFVDLPANFDWRNRGAVTATYNQGQCGSCWAFSTTENVESIAAIAGRGLNNLAVQQLVDCDPYDHGCGGGNPPNAYVYIEQAGGMESWNSYPYTGTDGGCSFNRGAVVVDISNWGYISTDDNVGYMAQWTYANGPPSVCVDAQYWYLYNGGVITQNCGNQIDHCVQITGWTVVSGISAWTVRNSWGADWGYGGYLYIAMAGDMCMIGNEVTSSVV